MSKSAEQKRAQRQQTKGRSIERVEDQRILSGNSQYVDDIEFPDMLYGRIFRSNRAHARIVDVDLTGVKAMGGVIDVISGKEALSMSGRYGNRRSNLPPERPPLAVNRARFAGEGIAAVAAETPYLAGDALEEIDVSYESMSVATRIEDAKNIENESQIIHPELHQSGHIDGNTWGAYDVDIGDVDTAFERADHIIEHNIKTSRPSATPMETHGAIADYDPGNQSLTLYSSTQEAHQIRKDLAELLDLDFAKVHVKQPKNMGGGFGHKLELHENEIIAALLSIRTERPVKVVLDRIEEFSSTRARQPQIHRMKLALNEDGKFLGLKDSITAGAGAYTALTMPGLWVSCHQITTPYWIENIQIRGECVFTNTVPSGAYRGFGLTQATTARESLIDVAARRLNFDPWQIRRANMISNEETPITHPTGLYLDSCGTMECLDIVNQSINRDLLDESFSDGKIRGLGVAAAMHVSSSKRPTYTADNSTVTIRVDEDASLTVLNDQCPMGTGIQTTLAQIIADELGVDHLDIEFTFGDTETTPFGLGSWGSRGISISGSAAYLAAREVRKTLLRIAAYQSGADIGDLDLVNGRVISQRSGNVDIPIEDLAYDAHYNGSKLPDNMTAGSLVVSESYDTPIEKGKDPNGYGDVAINYPSCVHAAIVEIDAQTGDIDILDYAIADDIGEVINPMIVEGQIQGGVIQGIGMALGENLEYSDSGQLLNGTMEDYGLPLINETPKINKIYEADVTSERTPLGTKGVGESGAIPSPVVIMNAVNNGLCDDVIEEPIHSMPLDSETVEQAYSQGDVN